MERWKPSGMNGTALAVEIRNLAEARADTCYSQAYLVNMLTLPRVAPASRSNVSLQPGLRPFTSAMLAPLVRLLEDLTRTTRLNGLSDLSELRPITTFRRARDFASTKVQHKRHHDVSKPAIPRADTR